MQLLTAWKDSLVLFIPKNFRQFLLLTANTIIQSYGVWIRYWWWLLPIYAGIVWRSGLLDEYAQTDSLAMQIAFLGIVGLIFFTFLLSVRASILRKDYAYFLKYAQRPDTYFLYCIISLSALIYFLDWSISIGTDWPSHLYMLFVAYCAQLWFLFFMFFLLDSRGTLYDAIRSSYQSLTMMVYSLPFFIGCFMIMLPIVLMLQELVPFSVAFIHTHFVGAFGLLLTWHCAISLPICFLSNVYIKKVHEQYSLYYK